VIPFVVAALTTTASSIVASTLEGMVMDKNAFLPHKWKLRLNRGLNNASIKRRFFFRRVLDRHILSLADQQLITGFALVLAGHIKFTSEIQGAHFSLIVCLGCLSSSPHLAGVITLRKYFIKQDFCEYGSSSYSHFCS
jgi:hypothetical protein